VDGAVDKHKLNIYEDGNNEEEFLILIKEIQNYVNIYEIWNNEQGAFIVYKNIPKMPSRSS
jgi:effector-binding domain-containing protein